MMRKILAAALAALFVLAACPAAFSAEKAAQTDMPDAELAPFTPEGELEWEIGEPEESEEKQPPEPAAVRPPVKVTDATQYSYEVTPLLAPFTYYLYVKTDNPDPESFMLVDPESEYFGPDDEGEIWDQENSSVFSYVPADPGTYYIARLVFADVVYENTATYRVPGGFCSWLTALTPTEASSF